MSGGILNFLDRPQKKNHSGKRCFPSKSLGVSFEAPTQFKLQNSLIDQNGYRWIQPDKNTLISHQRFVSIVGEGHIPQSFHENYKKNLIQNKQSLKRKKGFCSEFLDNHSWQNKVNSLMGFERTKQSRSLLDKELNTIKTSRKLKLKQKQKQFHHKTNSLSNSLSQIKQLQRKPYFAVQKNRIRHQRNVIYEKQLSMVSKKTCLQKLNMSLDTSRNPSYKNLEDLPLKIYKNRLRKIQIRSLSQNSGTIQNSFTNKQIISFRDSLVIPQLKHLPRSTTHQNNSDNKQQQPNYTNKNLIRPIRALYRSHQQ